MFLPHTYLTALLLMILSMVCWGSWANAQKIDAAWRFELFYLDYTLGLLAASVFFGLTLGRTDAHVRRQFLSQSPFGQCAEYLRGVFGGTIFSIGNILLVAAISVAGMSVAFPVGAGLALVLGTLLNYFVSATGNPVLFFGGVVMVAVAIALDALAYRELEGAGKFNMKGIILAVGGGIGARVVLSVRCEVAERTGPPCPLHRELYLCLGALTTALADELPVDAQAGDGTASHIARLHLGGGSCPRMGCRRRLILGARHDRELCCVLCSRDWPRDLVRHGRRQHDDIGSVGSFCVERVQGRDIARKTFARSDVFVLFARASFDCTGSDSWPGEGFLPFRRVINRASRQSQSPPASAAPTPCAAYCVPALRVRPVPAE